jgi:hypothetical protein
MAAVNQEKQDRQEGMESRVGFGHMVCEYATGYPTGKVQVTCNCGHVLLERPRRPSEDPAMFRMIPHLSYAHGQALARELGRFTCPDCGYSWEDARELFPGVWD